MTDGTIHQVSAEVGGLKADVKNLQRSIEAMTNMWRQQETAASDGRRLLHDKVEAVRTEVVDLKRDVQGVTEQFSEIRPAIDEFKNQRQRQIGAKSLGRYLWTAMLGAAGGFGWLVHEWLNMGAPKGH